jgi:hypothetical protein
MQTLIKDLKRIIEQLRQEKYFLYDVVYTAVDYERVSIEEGISLEIDRRRNVHASLSRLLINHLSQGLKLRPVKADISFKSYRIKVPEQCHSKIDNRYDYPIEVDFQKRLWAPSKNLREFPSVRKMYEDIERIFRQNNWQFDTEKP